jgi:hypothetical protein
MEPINLTEKEIEQIKENVKLLRPTFIYQLIKILMDRKFIKLNYKKNNQILSKYFELKTTNGSNFFYSPSNQTMTLYSVIEDVHEVISFDDIEAYEYTTQGTDTHLSIVQNQKKLYHYFKETISKKSAEYKYLDNVFFDKKLITMGDLPYIVCLKIKNVEEYYSPTPEQLSQYRQTMSSLLNEEIAKQKEIITNEFKTLQQENNSLQDDELQSILSFIQDVKQNTNFEDCETVFKMFDIWPTMLTSPVSTWLHENPWK